MRHPLLWKITYATYLVIPANAGIQKQFENTGFRVKPGMTGHAIYEPEIRLTTDGH